VFELDDVTVRFGRTLALETGRVHLEEGTTVALMGPNGSGKTTLLRLLAGLQKPTTGRLTTGESTTVAYVAQHQHQHRWMPLTVAEVVSMGRYRTLGLFGRLRRRDRELIEGSAARLGITGILTRPFSELSGGQRQRVLVAGALTNDARCLLLDEPITGLDLPSQQIILDVIAAERDLGRLVMISTHHLDEARQCDRVLLLNTSVVADGPPQKALTETNLARAFGSGAMTIVHHREGVDDARVVVVDDHGHGDHPNHTEMSR
jgi:ABC-type Mn2+/Zn2+ transport system ATPase subunit